MARFTGQKFKSPKDYLRNLYRREKGARSKPFGNIKVALVYPNTYSVGMSNLGFQWVYHIINSHPSFKCDRVFLTPYERVLTVESLKPLGSYDLIAFSLSFETDYSNVVQILEKSGIPAARRQRNESHPLIIAGGVAPSINPAPMSYMLDAVLRGEAEGMLPRFLEVYSEHAGRGKQAILEAISAIEGVFVPATSSAPRSKTIPEKIDFPAHSVIITEQTEFKNRNLIEIGRGCVHGCRFCAARSAYHPPRFVPAGRIIEAAHVNRQFTANVGLVGAAIANHPAIDQICASLHEDNFRISVSSLRADSASDSLLKTLAAGGQKMFTIAPETGSEKLRKMIGKNLTDDQILDCAERARKAGLRFIKLYFMIGLPQEEQSDLFAIVNLAARVAKILPARVSINPFIPKPSTPMENQPMAGRETLSEKIAFLRKELASTGIKVRMESLREALLEALLSRGDAAVGEALAVHKLDQLDWSYYIHRAVPSDEIPPWEIQSG